MLTNASEVLSSKNASNLLDKLFEIECEIVRLEIVKVRVWGNKSRIDQFSPAWKALLWHLDRRMYAAREKRDRLLQQLIDG